MKIVSFLMVMIYHCATAMLIRQFLFHKNYTMKKLKICVLDFKISHNTSSIHEVEFQAVLSGKVINTQKEVDIL